MSVHSFHARSRAVWQSQFASTAAVAIASLVVLTLLEGGPAVAALATAPGPDWTQPGATNGLTAPDAVAASMLARVRLEPVEDLSQRTESSQSFALPDGQWRSDMSMGPEFVRTGGDSTTSEGWKPVDSTLVEFTDGSIRPAAHSGDLVFSGGGEGDTALVSGVNADGGDFVLNWEGVVPTPVVDEDAIRYVDVRPGIDLVFFVTATGYEQFFVAKTPGALDTAKALELSFSSPDNAIRAGGDSLVVTSDEGEIVADVTQVEAWDAESDANRIQPVLEMAVPDEDSAAQSSPSPSPSISPSASASTAPSPSTSPSPSATDEMGPGFNAPPVTVAVDSDYTVSGDVGEVSIDPADVPFTEEASFPVVIDPSVNLTLSFDTMVSSNSTVDRSSDTELIIGTFNSGTAKYRSFFNVNPAPIIGKKVTSATFKIYEYHAWSCTPKSWEVWSSGTSSSATRWTKMPTPTTKHASTTATKGYSSSCADGYVTQNVTTLADAWSKGSNVTKGFALKAGSETDNSYWKRFYSGNSSSNKPVLSVVYNSYPSTPTSVKVNDLTPASTLYTNDTTLKFSAKVSDADGGSVKGRFTVTKGSSTVVTKASGSAVASGSTSSYTTSALAQGDYKVEAWANDSALDSKASSKPSWTVTVDTTAPGTTAITSPQFTNGQWKDTAPPSISAALSATDAVKFEYKVDGGTTKTMTATSGSASVSALPRTNGGHKLEARAIDRANNSGAWKTFEYGVGAVGISSPAANFKTTSLATIKASAPVGTNGAVKRALYWRASGTANGSGYSNATGSSAGWSKIVDLADTATGANPALSYAWDASTAAATAGKSRVPFLIDLQVCFTYTYTNDTLCTWRDAVDSQRTVMRIPHAFGDNFPVASAGPGQVAMWTGEFNTSITDLEVPGYTGALSLSRTYSTFAGGRENSVFGPGWAPSFEGSDVGVAGLAVYDTTAQDGLMSFEDVDGSYLFFRQAGTGRIAQKTGTYTALDEDTAAMGMTVTLTGAGTAAKLTLTEDDGVKTVWAHLGAGKWVQEKVIEPGSSATTTFTRDSSGRVTKILAPVPDGVDCATAMAAGCRGLRVEYYTSTTATSSTLGGFQGRVSKVYYDAYNPDLTGSPAPACPTMGAGMDCQLVVTYSYDSTGLLRKVTDSRNHIDLTYDYSGVSDAGVPLLVTVKPADLAAWRMSYADTFQGTDSLALVERDAAVGTGPAVTMSRYVYGLNPSALPGGMPNAATAVEAWGQSRVPTWGVATFGPGEDPGTSNPASISASQWKNANVSFTDAEGYTVNTAEYGAGQWLYTALEFDDGHRVVRELDAAATVFLTDQASANDGQPAAEDLINSVASITRYNEEFTVGSVTVPAGTRVTDEWAPASDNGGDGLARVHTQYAYDEGAPGGGINPNTGQPFGLATTETEYRSAADSGHWDPAVPVATNEPVLGVTKSGYDPIESADALGATSGWILGTPTVSTLVMADPSDNIVSRTRYDALGREVESRGPGSNGANAHTDRTIYYTAGDNLEDSACGNKPQWAGLECVTRTGEATPTIPVTRIEKYSMLLAPETVTETLDGVVRTGATEYLADGRTSETSLTVTGLSGTAPVPTSKVEYDAGTGLPTATVSYDSANIEIGRVSTVSDAWGRNLAYIDTDGVETKNTFDSAGRLETVSDPKRVVTYGYDGIDVTGAEEHRGLGTSMTISGVGTFKAAYDASGNMTRQEMPGGLSQLNEYTLTGEPVGLSYTAVNVDGDTEPLIGWTQVSDLYGRVVGETTPSAAVAPGLGTEFARGYSYDRAGRLVKVEDRTAAVGELFDDDLTDAEAIQCVTRSYGFDVNGNRLSRSTAVSGSDGACTTTSDQVETWAYDGADRVQSGANSTGSYVYDVLGRQTTMPAIDSPMGMAAGNLSIGYYDNDLVHTLSQNGATTTFGLDPMGRRSDAVAVSGTDTTTVTRHYGDATDNPTYVTTSGPDGDHASWYETSLGGDLGVVVTDGVVSLQLADIHGDIATSLTVDAENTVTGVGAFGDFDEYGRLLTVQPDTGGVTYGWLGGKERAIDGATGLLLMGVRLYNPNTGLFTSMDPVTGGNTTAYAYPQDPINKFDLDGKAWGWLKKVGSLAWKYKGDIALTAAGFIPGVGALAWGFRVYRVVKLARAAQTARNTVASVRATRATAYAAGRIWARGGVRGTMKNGKPMFGNQSARAYRTASWKGKRNGYSSNLTYKSNGSHLHSNLHIVHRSPRRFR